MTEDLLKKWSGTGTEIEAMKEKKAVITTSLGTILLGFFPEKAPNHVASFFALVEQGFYDGTLIHRVVPNFIVQGGDPNSRDGERKRFGTGGPGYCLVAEINDHRHLRGTVAMARSASLDSGGSQFFINLADNPSLDGQYTVFGEVLEGMEVVEQIAKTERDKNDIPLEDIRMTIKLTGT